MVKKVIHLEFKATSEHHYFGSMLSIYNNLTEDKIAMCPSYGSLRNYGLSEKKPYENNHVIIRKGDLKTSGVILKKKDKKIIE